MPDVSVIMPAHNAERYITEALEDFAGQTYRDFELIVVDDGSVDGTAEIVEAFCRRDSRLRLIHQECVGAALARNCGLKASVGEYVVFVDADDRFSTEFLGLMRAGLVASDAEVAVCSADCFVAEGDAASPYIRIPRNLDGLHGVDDFGDGLISTCSTVPWNKLVHKDHLLANGILFQDIPVNNDVFYSCMVMALSNNIFGISDPLVHYRMFSGSSLQDKRSKYPQCGLTAVHAVLKAIAGEFSERPALARGLNSLFVNTFYYSFYASLERPDGREAARGIYDSWIDEAKSLVGADGSAPSFNSLGVSFKHYCLCRISFEGLAWACSGAGDHRDSGVARKLRIACRLVLARIGFGAAR